MRISLWACVAAAPSLAWASPPGQRVAGQVDEATYRYVLDNLLFTHYGDSRGIGGADHHAARDNILAEFAAYGLACRIESFEHKGTTGYNVVAELTGSVRPEDIYIIGAHYDSVNNPGADDNASGVAGVLEAARVISRYESDATIRFVAFDMEEVGLAGADAYVALHANENMLGMISLDMIAYDPGDAGEALIYGRSLPIKQALAGALVEYAGITSTLQHRMDASDHAPFEWLGFRACWLAEADIWDNPNYHQWNDSVDAPGYINYAYAADMTRAVAGWLTDAAGVQAPCPGDFNRDERADTLDVLGFLNAWAAADLAADFNADGAVDSLDVLAFLDAWAAGC